MRETCTWTTLDDEMIIIAHRKVMEPGGDEARNFRCWCERHWNRLDDGTQRTIVWRTAGELVLHNQPIAVETLAWFKFISWTWQMLSSSSQETIRRESKEETVKIIDEAVNLHLLLAKPLTKDQEENHAP